MTPKPADFRVTNHFSLFTVEPLTDAARTWLAEHVSGEATYYGPALIVEWRYLADLMRGADEDGLTVEA